MTWLSIELRLFLASEGGAPFKSLNGEDTELVMWRRKYSSITTQLIFSCWELSHFEQVGFL